MKMEVHPATQNVYRDTTINFTKSPLETSLLPAATASTASVRRTTRTTATVATAGVRRRRLIKKHIQQKYLLCGFAIHAFLSTPAYLYGNVVETDKDLVLRIWPAIVFQATGELTRSIVEHLDAQYHGRPRETTQYRRFFLLVTFIICFSLMVSGILFSSAWIPVSTTTQTLAIIFYGCFAGLGSSLFIWKTHVILEGVRPREDKFVRKTIKLCGEAFCQLFLSFAFTSLRTLYGTAQSIMLMSALLVNLIPISLIITRHREEGSATKRISVIKAESGAFPPLHHQLGRFSSNFADQMDGLEHQLQRWKHGNVLEQHPLQQSQQIAAVAESHNNYMLGTDEAYVTFVNPNGVEIMEIIPEEDENSSVMRASSLTIENYGHVSLHTSQTLNKSISNGLKYLEGPDAYGNLTTIKHFSHDMTTHLWTNFVKKLVIPLQRALLIPKLYSTTILLSTDIFSYVMCLTVLPGLAITHHAIKNAEIPFLYSLLAFPWMCFSLMTPRFGSSLHKRKFQWTMFGFVCKALALILISFSSSKLLLSVSSVLLGFGQAVTLFLQESVIQMGMARAQWEAIRIPVHFTNGLLVLVWGSLAHLAVVRYSFQATVGLAGGLYAFAVILWILIFLCCSSRD